MITALRGLADPGDAGVRVQTQHQPATEPVDRNIRDFNAIDDDAASLRERLAGERDGRDRSRAERTE